RGPVWFTSDGAPRLLRAAETGSAQGRSALELVDLNDGRILREYFFSQKVERGTSAARAERVAVSRDGAWIAAALTVQETNGVVGIWESETGKLQWETRRACSALALSPEGECLALGDGLGGVHLLSRSAGTTMAEFHQDKTAIRSLAF